MQQRLFQDIHVDAETPEGSSNEFYTPAWFVTALERGNGGEAIDVDPAAAPHGNTRAKRVLVGQHGQNGLTAHWTKDGLPLWMGNQPSRLVYNNPPYKVPSAEEKAKLPAHWCFGDQGDFVRKAHAEWRANHADMIVLLIQQQAIGAGYAHECIRDQAAVAFPHGRLRFEDANGVPAAQGGTFASAIVIYTSIREAFLRMQVALGAACSRHGHPLWWIHLPPHLT